MYPNFARVLADDGSVLEGTRLAMVLLFTAILSLCVLGLLVCPTSALMQQVTMNSTTPDKGLITQPRVAKLKAVHWQVGQAVGACELA